MSILQDGEGFLIFYFEIIIFPKKSQFYSKIDLYLYKDKDFKEII